MRAARLRCEVAAVKAVAHLESRGAGLYGDGFPVILFERHKFRFYTKGKYNEDYPKISGPAGGLRPGPEESAGEVQPGVKPRCGSGDQVVLVGKFQIMGFNYEICGFDTVGGFVDAMKESEGRQLDAFVAFVIANGLDRFLRSKNWTAFARGYTLCSSHGYSRASLCGEDARGTRAVRSGLGVRCKNIETNWVDWYSKRLVFR